MDIKVGDLFYGMFDGNYYIVMNKENGLKTTFRLFSLKRLKYIFENEDSLRDPFIYGKKT